MRGSRGVGTYSRGPYSTRLSHLLYDSTERRIAVSRLGMECWTNEVACSEFGGCTSLEPTEELREEGGGGKVQFAGDLLYGEIRAR